MLLLGPIHAIPNNVKRLYVYNFSSYNEQFPRLGLIPNPSIFPNNGFGIDSRDIDRMYYDLIINNDVFFMQLMQIIIPLYNGEDVYLLTSDTDNDYILDIKESLLKLIQQRYGYNAAEINNREDYDFFNPEDFCFSEIGLNYMKGDQERYQYIAEANRLMHGGRPHEFD